MLGELLLGEYYHIKAVTAPFICSIVLAPIWYLYQFGTFFVLVLKIRYVFLLTLVLTYLQIYLAFGLYESRLLH